jgi:hypothetical protein
MHNNYVVDTNVLIAASAADPVNPRDIDATPRDPSLRLKVWEWLKEFRSSSSCLVLDQEGKIFEEYKNKLGFGDYGIQVVMHKWSTCAVGGVSLRYDSDGHAILPASLEQVVHDLADRKMVAACLEAIRVYEDCCIAFAGDTDWHDWEDALIKHGICLEPIIEAWSRCKHASKTNG